MQCLIIETLERLKVYGCLSSPPPQELSHTPGRFGVIHQGRLVVLTCSCNAVCILGLKREATALLLASQFLTGNTSGGLGAIRLANFVGLSMTSSASMILPILKDGTRNWKQSGISVDGDRGMFAWVNLDQL